MDKGAPYLTYLHMLQKVESKRDGIFSETVLITHCSVGVDGANKEYKGKGIHGESSGLP